MQSIGFVTGNDHKANALSRILGLPIERISFDTPEIQSLNIEEVAQAKAQAAFATHRRPLLVEDTSLEIQGLGKLPGTYIKWFLQEVGQEGICHLVDSLPSRVAVARCAFVYVDRENLQIFSSAMSGTIADRPRGSSGFGWDTIFIPEGFSQTRAEMEPSLADRIYNKIKPIEKVRTFLTAMADGDMKHAYEP